MRGFKDSRFKEEEVWMASGCPRNILDAVFDKWKPSSCLDIGCGIGSAMEHLMSKGVECFGIEGSKAAFVASRVKNRIRIANLNRPVELGRKFDLVWSYEVAEHIHPQYTNAFLDTLTHHGDIVVLSAALPGQGGAGHFNEQPRIYWIAKLRDLGFEFDSEFSTHLQTMPDDHARNLMAFVRKKSKATDAAACGSAAWSGMKR